MWITAFTLFSMVFLIPAVYAEDAMLIRVKEFGLVADGVTDDGPAILKALEAAKSHSGPTILIFPERGEIYAATGDRRYLFHLNDRESLSVNGNGSTFFLHPHLRFMRATGCRDLSVRDLNIDMRPTPAIEAVVHEVSEDSRSIKARLIAPTRSEELGGPTNEDGEQTFFGMLWPDGSNQRDAQHIYVNNVESTESSVNDGIVQVQLSRPIAPGVRSRVELGKSRVSLPVPGIAHRFGPGALIVIDDCHNVTVEGVDVWSAPWFVYQVFRNDGDIVFRNADIRPPADSNRLTTSWRDGFHVKGNRGRLLFEDCDLEGMNDDAFNISTHAWNVEEVTGPQSLKLRQLFPLSAMLPSVGGSLLIVSPDSTQTYAPATVESIRIVRQPPQQNEREAPRAPIIEITVDREVAEVAAGSTLWDLDTSNPETVIRRCRIRQSSRIQSPVLMEDCDVVGLVWLYSESVEGPYPTGSILRGNTFRQGRGNPSVALSVLGWREDKPESIPDTTRLPLVGVEVTRNKFHGDVVFDGVGHATFLRNKLLDRGLVVRRSPGFETDHR
jgi:hypothetical protein